MNRAPAGTDSPAGGAPAGLAGGAGVELLPRLGPAVADYPPGSTFGPRDAASYQFVWILRGGASWACDDVRLSLSPGTLLLIRPGMRDMFSWADRTPTRHAYVHFRFTRAPADDAGWPLTRDLSGGRDPMAALCHYLLTLGSARPPGWEAHACEALRLLVVTFVGGPVRAGMPAALPESVVAMMSEVRTQWAGGVARAVPLAQLAASAGVSISTLCRVFRQRFGVGPTAALERLRLARAEPLLWMSNLSLQAVAVQCGFHDAYHFSRRFRLVYGMAPSTFRRTAPHGVPESPVEREGLTALVPLAPVTPTPTPTSVSQGPRGRTGDGP